LHNNSRRADIDDVQFLKNALLEAVKTCNAIPDKINQYGQKIIDFPLNHQNKTAIIQSV
jgi:hypothetical protein